MLAVIGLGSNLGSRLAFLRAATARVGQIPGVSVEGVSPVFDSAPVGPPQGRYLNAAVRVRTELALDRLLSDLLGVERELGRVRGQRNGPRTIDLDILWSDGPPLAGPSLTVPHPRLLSRAFALAPLLAVLPGPAPAAYRERLLALGGPPPRWPGPPTRATQVHDRGDQLWVEARATDWLDALALAAEPPRVTGLGAVRSQRVGISGPDGVVDTLLSLLFRQGLAGPVAIHPGQGTLALYQVTSTEGSAGWFAHEVLLHQGERYATCRMRMAK